MHTYKTTRISVWLLFMAVLAPDMRGARYEDDEDDDDILLVEEAREERGAEKKEKRGFRAWIDNLSEETRARILYGCAFVVAVLLFLYFFYPAPLHYLASLVSPEVRKAVIKEGDPMAIFAKNNPTLLVQADFNYKSKSIYQDIGGYAPSKVCLVNAANDKLDTGGGGTNSFLTDLIKHKAGGKGKKPWGTITDMHGKPWDAIKPPKGEKRKLNIGEYATSKHVQTGVTIVHILGPKLREGEKRLGDLSQGITKFLESVKNMPDNERYEVIIFPAMSTGLFTKNDQQKCDGYGANIKGINNFYRKNPDGLGGTILCLNWWEMDGATKVAGKYIEGMTHIPKPNFQNGKLK